MDGYDADFVSEVPSDLECGICLFVVRDPVQIMACGHRFCSHCFETLKKLPAERLRCPKDNGSIDINRVFPDTAAQRTVNNLIVKCSKSRQGCNWQGSLQELEKHLKGCLLNNPKDLVQEHILDQLNVLEETIKKKDLEYLNLRNEFLKHKKEMENFSTSANSQLNELIASNNDLTLRIQQLEKLKNVDSVKSSLPSQNALKERPKISVVPSLVPKVSNLVQKPVSCYTWKIDRKSGKRLAFFTSPSFYSSDEGYLCQLQLSTHGCLHLCLNILKGQFDGQLVWPFNMKVEFVCFNKSERHSLIYPLKMKADMLSPRKHASYEDAVILTPAVFNSCIIDELVTIEVYIT